MKEIKIIYTIKIKYVGNQTLDPIGGGIISNKIILPTREFGTSVLMNSPLGKTIYSKGGILMGIQSKLWGAMLIYTIMTWCMAFVIIWIIYS